MNYNNFPKIYPEKAETACHQLFCDESLTPYHHPVVSSQPMNTDIRKADGYEPRFDIDAEYGRQGELFVSSIIDSLAKGSVEVKRDSRFANTGNIFVEYECLRQGSWMKSGIATSEADTWVYVLGDSQVVIAMPREVLKELALEMWRNPRNRREEKDGSHPAKGVIIPLHKLVGWAQSRA